MPNRHPLRFGLQTGQQSTTWAQLVDVWTKADASGYDSLWNYDHLYPIFADPAGPCLEGWTTLAALAQVTKKARIGTLVSCNAYRNPALLAKMAITVDHICGGRLNLGLGSGWFELEHRSFGFDFKPVRQRLAALDEACSIIHGMMRGETVTREGAHHKVHEVRAVPGPVQPGGPPLMIGGQGRNVLLRIVARWADMWNHMDTPAGMADVIGAIRRHGDEVGRDTDEIEKTVLMPICYTTDTAWQETMCQVMAHTFQIPPEQAADRIMMGSKDQCLERIDAYAKVGVTHFIFMLFAPTFDEQLQAFAEEVVPAARAS